MSGPLVVYVDVDDTLIRTIGNKQIPISGVVEHVRSLAAAGVELYCWSAGGGPYARSVAEQLGIAELFTHFLPKPLVLIDDRPVSEWRRLLTVHPLQCSQWTASAYRQAVAEYNPGDESSERADWSA